MRWIVRVARTMDDIEALKKLSMAVDDDTVWMEEIDD